MATVVTIPPLEGKEGQGGDDSILVCDSLPDFASHADSPDKWVQPRNGGYSLHSQWALNGDTREGILGKAIHGDLSAAEKADKLLDKFNADLDFHTFAWKSVDSVAGGAVNIGAYCAGSPLCMRQRRRVALETAPLSIVVDICASSSVDSEAIETRGVAVLALLQRLSNVRPVQLFIASAHRSPAGGNVGILIKMETPIDLATVGNAMASTGFMRHLCFGAEHAIKDFGTGAKPWSSHSEYRRNGAAFWRRLSGDEQTLFIPPLMDSEEITVSPYQWVEKMLSEYGGMQQEV
jgi:hypothetical protein